MRYPALTVAVGLWTWRVLCRAPEAIRCTVHRLVLLYFATRLLISHLLCVPIFLPSPLSKTLNQVHNGSLQPHARPGPERAEQTTLAQGAVSSHERGCYRGRGGVLHVRVTRGRMVQRRRTARTMSELLLVRTAPNAPYHVPHRSNVYHAHTTLSLAWTAHGRHYRPLPPARGVPPLSVTHTVVTSPYRSRPTYATDDARRVPPHPTYNIPRCRRGWGTVA